MGAERQRSNRPIYSGASSRNALESPGSSRTYTMFGIFFAPITPKCRILERNWRDQPPAGPTSRPRPLTYTTRTLRCRSREAHPHEPESDPRTHEPAQPSPAQSSPSPTQCTNPRTYEQKQPSPAHHHSRSASLSQIPLYHIPRWFACSAYSPPQILTVSYIIYCADAARTPQNLTVVYGVYCVTHLPEPL